MSKRGGDGKLGTLTLGSVGELELEGLVKGKRQKLRRPKPSEAGTTDVFEASQAASVLIKFNIKGIVGKPRW